MSSRLKRSEASQLERYRVSLENVRQHPEIAATLAEFGYDLTVIAEGQTLFNETRGEYDTNKIEKEEKLASYKTFAQTENTLDKAYTLHRKKAKIVFAKELVVLSKLEIDKAIPDNYIEWLETVKIFYTTISDDEALQQKLARLKVPAEEITLTSEIIASLEQARAEYLRERGESQAATKKKKESFKKINEWMSEFYAVAKIAFEDTPQLLEVLGVYVKS